jgi:hypothetical protein
MEIKLGGKMKKTLAAGIMALVVMVGIGLVGCSEDSIVVQNTQHVELYGNGIHAIGYFPVGAEPIFSPSVGFIWRYR